MDAGWKNLMRGSFEVFSCSIIVTFATSDHFRGLQLRNRRPSASKDGLGNVWMALAGSLLGNATCFQHQTHELMEVQKRIQLPTGYVWTKR